MHILQMMVDSIVLSHLNYALPVWGPPLSSDLINRLRRLHNRAVCVVFSLCKYDHVSSHRSRLGWLPLEFTIQYRSLLAMHRQFVGDRCLLLNQYGLVLSINIILEHHLVLLTSIFYRHRLSYSKKSFRGKATMWWNSLPVNLTQCTPGDFMDSLFNFLIAS